MTNPFLAPTRTLFPLAMLLAACGTTSPTDPGGPVTSVVIAGAERIKVGEPYQFTVTAKVADGTVVTRATTWSMVTADKATVSNAGVLTATATGNMVLRATVEGVEATRPLTGYDWVTEGGGAATLLKLVSDNRLLNTDNVGDYPELVIGCAGGTLVIAVTTPTFELANGNVAYNFNHGDVINSTWLVSNGNGALQYPGPTNLVHKQFLATLRASSTFGFRFNEVQGGNKVASYRLTGLAQRLPALLAGCPSDQ